MVDHRPRQLGDDPRVQRRVGRRRGGEPSARRARGGGGVGGAALDVGDDELAEIAQMIESRERQVSGAATGTTTRARRSRGARVPLSLTRARARPPQADQHKAMILSSCHGRADGGAGDAPAAHAAALDEIVAAVREMRGELREVKAHAARTTAEIAELRAAVRGGARLAAPARELEA